MAGIVSAAWERVRSRRRFGVLVAVIATGMVAGSSVVPAAVAQPGRGTAPVVSMPRDEGTHSTSVEWWYWVGEVEGRTATGKPGHFSYLVTFSRTLGVTVADYQMVDLRTGDHYSEGDVVVPNERSLPGGGISIHDGGRSAVGKEGRYTLRGGSDDGQRHLDLRSTPNKPVALQGRGGLMKPYGNLGSTWYTSYTNLTMTGTITFKGDKYRVTGKGWHDHQWFTPPVERLSSLSWDWHALQLDDGRDYMVYLTRGRDGKFLNPMGNVIAPDGTSTPLDPTKLSNKGLGSWKSPDTGKRYTVGWEVTVPGGTLKVTPLTMNHESAMAFTPPTSYLTPQLWEGPVRVSGTIDGKKVTGRGFTETLRPTL